MIVSQEDNYDKAYDLYWTLWDYCQVMWRLRLVNRWMGQSSETKRNDAIDEAVNKLIYRVDK